MPWHCISTSRDSPKGSNNPTHHRQPTRPHGRPPCSTTTPTIQASAFIQTAHPIPRPSLMRCNTTSKTSCRNTRPRPMRQYSRALARPPVPPFHKRWMRLYASNSSAPSTNGFTSFPPHIFHQHRCQLPWPERHDGQFSMWQSLPIDRKQHFEVSHTNIKQGIEHTFLTSATPTNNKCLRQVRKASRNLMN